MIYILTNGEAVKIGWSRDPHRRVRDLQGASHLPLTLVRTIDAPNPHTEAALHELLKADRIRGEWFSLAVLDELRPMADTDIRALPVRDRYCRPGGVLRTPPCRPSLISRPSDMLTSTARATGHRRSARCCAPPWRPSRPSKKAAAWSAPRPRAETPRGSTPHTHKMATEKHTMLNDWRAWVAIGFAIAIILAAAELWRVWRESRARRWRDAQREIRRP